MLLHVVLADDNIQRVRTEGLPETVDELKIMLKTRLNLEGEMVIQFQDEEFGGRTPSSLEEERESLLDEVKKKKPDCNLIDSLMGRTFALRRQEIVENEPLVTEIESRWPALFSERQIGAEFTRLVSVDLLKSFLSGLDQHLPRLINLFEARKRRETKLGHDTGLQSLLESLDSENSNQNKRSAALLGLPFFLKEKFSKTTDSVDVPAVIKGVDVGLLITTEQNAEMTAQSKNIVDAAVILEERIVLHRDRHKQREQLAAIHSQWTLAS
ncbi:hypothetical protein ABVT39_027640 [Epinephelus coioides]